MRQESRQLSRAVRRVSDQHLPLLCLFGENLTAERGSAPLLVDNELTKMSEPLVAALENAPDSSSGMRRMSNCGCESSTSKSHCSPLLLVLYINTAVERDETTIGIRLLSMLLCGHDIAAEQVDHFLSCV